MKKFESIMVGTLVVLVAFGLIAIGISPAFTQMAVVDSGKLTNERMSQIKGGDNPRPHCTEATYECPTIIAGTCFKAPHMFEATEGASACSSTSVRSMGDDNYLKCKDEGTQVHGNDRKCGTEQTRYCARKTVCLLSQIYGGQLSEDGTVCQLTDGASGMYCGFCQNAGTTSYDPDSAHTFQVCDPIVN